MHTAATERPVPAERATSRPGVADLGLLFLRVFAGLSLTLAHGVGKLPPSEGFIAGAAEMGFPLPVLFAWAAALSKSLGGFLLALGLLTRPAAFFIVVTMSVAAFVRQAGDPFGDLELPLLYGFVALQFLFTGSGRFGLDALLRPRNRLFT
jgi:putative oxidoreductase